MSAFCPEGCPDADACVVGYPCTLHPAPVSAREDEGAKWALRLVVCTERSCGNRVRYSELTDDLNTHWHIAPGLAMFSVERLVTEAVAAERERVAAAIDSLPWHEDPARADALVEAAAIARTRQQADVNRLDRWREGCAKLAERNQIQAFKIEMSWEHLIRETARASGMHPRGVINSLTIPPMPASYALSVAVHGLKAALWDALGGKVTRRTR